MVGDLEGNFLCVSVCEYFSQKNAFWGEQEDIYCKDNSVPNFSPPDK